MTNYSLLATGNFNETTGRFYTDHVFFTSAKEFSDELQQLFLVPAVKIATGRS
jgi:polyphosphate kinase